MEEKILIIEEAPSGNSLCLEGDFGVEEEEPQNREGAFSIFNEINVAKEMDLL